MRKAIILTLTFFVFRIFMSCCPEAMYYNYRWANPALTNLLITGYQSELLQTDSVQASRYGFRLTFEAERVAQSEFKLSGFNQANALSCDRGGLSENVDTLTSLTVFTQNVFDNTHPAGSDITPLLAARSSYASTDSLYHPYKLVKDYLHQLNIDGASVNGLNISFRNTSPFTGPHRFRVSATTVSGRVLADTVAIRFY